MNETLLFPGQPAAQYDEDDVLDAWLALLTPEELDRILNRLADHEFASAPAFELPA